MNKEKALKNQGLEFREDILLEGAAFFCAVYWLIEIKNPGRKVFLPDFFIKTGI